MDMRPRKPTPHPMPEVAAFIADLRDAFGDTTIDDIICRGKAGEPVFYVCENGTSVGTASASSTNAWQVDESLRDRQLCPGCDGTCVGEAVPCADWLKRRNMGKKK
ncbi:hypothetical protein [Paraburkholderia sp. BL10I2N1]|uniref:hypothetical protein n=1 Tax=Paraburkholderia sp. BL10I2N1 TaxID=1938796 RepID=UPI00105FB382|nr:hypothetical protein [Paraburkholderia sp. BL10I2N1]TDN59312.1 hypothetical protein B0G77_8518 [Paraburkholderia sp. BL10I2N1]